MAKAKAKLEFRALADGAWYEGIARFDGSALHVHFEGYSKSEDEEWPSSRFRFPAEVKKHIRGASECMQDHHCASLYDGMLVCAACKFQDGRVLFYDAIVKNVRRKKHLINKQGEEICSCSFLVLWQYGPKLNHSSVVRCGDICLISSADVTQDDHISSFWKSIEEREMSIDKGSTLGETPMKRKAICLRKESTFDKLKKRSIPHNMKMDDPSKEIVNNKEVPSKENVDNNQVVSALHIGKESGVCNEPSQDKHTKLITKYISGKREVGIKQEKCVKIFSEKPFEVGKADALISNQAVVKRCIQGPDVAINHLDHGGRSISSCVVEDENRGVNSDMLQDRRNYERVNSGNNCSQLVSLQENNCSQILSSQEMLIDNRRREHGLRAKVQVSQDHLESQLQCNDTHLPSVKREQMDLSQSRIVSCYKTPSNSETHNSEGVHIKLESNVDQQEAMANICKSSSLMYGNDSKVSSHGHEAKYGAVANKGTGIEHHFEQTSMAGTVNLRSIPASEQAQFREKDGEDVGSSTDCFGLVNYDPRRAESTYCMKMKTFCKQDPTGIGFGADKRKCSSWKISQMLLVENVDKVTNLEVAFSTLLNVSPGLEFLCVLPTVKNDSSSNLLACYQDVESADLTLKNLIENKLCIEYKGRTWKISKAEEMLDPVCLPFELARDF